MPVPTEDPVTEAVARQLCASRGADPDQSITIGRPDGTIAAFDVAWWGYVDTAEAIIETVRNASG